MISEKKRFRLFLLAVAATLLFSFLPGFHLENMLGLEYDLGLDIFQHAGYYFALTLFLIYINNGDKRWAIWVLLITVSTLLEFGQALIPRRSFSPHDILSNIGGITLAVLVWPLFEKKKPRRKSRHSVHRRSGSRH